jgi:hypothetical protein
MVAGKVAISAPMKPIAAVPASGHLPRFGAWNGQMPPSWQPVKGLDIDISRDRLRNLNCKGVWEATWMWIVWFMGTGSWRRKVTVWLPLVPNEPAARGIGAFPEWSTEAKRDSEDNDR